MSKTYRVRLGAVRGAGEDKRRIACPPLVPEMPTLLGDALAAQGWDVHAGIARKRFDGVDATITLHDPTLELKAEVAIEVVGRSYEPNDNDALGMAAAREDGEAKRAQAKRTADQRAAEAVIGVETRVREEVHGAVKVALLEALTRKAQQLGRVASVERGTDADGRAVTTITVEV